MDSDSAEMIGQLLAGRYRLDKFLGEGGLGRVYRAMHVTVGRVVAIKILHPEHATRPDAVERFLTEARAAHLVRHHHVVEVYDAGVIDGVPYIVQELLEGEDLAAYLARKGGRLSPEVALERTLPILMALAHVHRHGLVHRDIKPDNIFLANDDGFIVPKLLDFGISILFGADNMTRKTDAHVIMGTPAYMAPEQIEHTGEITPAVDVWGFGVLLYELVSGRLPFSGETTQKMLRSILSRDPYSLALALPDADGELVDIVHHCLTAEIEDRYADAGALGVELAEYALKLAVPNARAVLDGLAGIRLPVAPQDGRFRSSFRPPPKPSRQVDQGAVTVESSGLLELADLARGFHPSVVPDDETPAEDEDEDEDEDQDKDREPDTPLQITTVYHASGKVDLDSVVGTGGETLAAPVSSDPPPRKRNRTLLVALALIAPLAVAGILLAPYRVREPPPMPVKRPAPALENPRRVMFTIDSQTPRAQVELRGHTYPLPLEIELEPREHPETLEVSAPGHRSRRMHLTIDRQIRIVANLEPIVAATAVGPTDPPITEPPAPPSHSSVSHRPREDRGEPDPSSSPETPPPDEPVPPPEGPNVERNPYLNRDPNPYLLRHQKGPGHPRSVDGVVGALQAR